MNFYESGAKAIAGGDPLCEVNGVYQFAVVPVGASFRTAGSTLDKYVAPFWR